MSFIGAALGGGGGSAANYSAQAAPVQTAVTPEMLRLTQQQVQQGVGQQSDIVNILGNQQGIGKEADVYQQQQALAQQLQQNALGQGPNPAQAQLAQATAANTANQAALMAGQRGAGANAGLIARQAAMQGGANQQASAGQAATLGAQQQLAAQSALGQQQQAMGNTAGNLANQYLGAQQNYNALTQGNQANMFNSIANMNNANISNASQMNQQNGAMARQNAGFNQSVAQGLLGGAGAALGLADGGMVPEADISNKVIDIAKPDANTSSNMSKFLSGAMSKMGKSGSMPMAGAGDSMSMALMAASKGGPVPGKAKVKGDSYSNDNVPAMLSPGEVVIPRRIMQGANAAEQAKAFVAAIIAKNGRAR